MMMMMMTARARRSSPALVAACACACAAWIKRAFDARRRAKRDDRGTEKTMKDSRRRRGADGADDPVKKRLSFSGMSASSLASGGEEEEEKKPSRAMATRAERIEEETTTANGAETNGTKSPSAPSTPTREASREKRERQASLSPSRRPAMKLEVLGGASQGATFVASLGVDEFTVGRGRGEQIRRGERRGVHRARQVSMGWCGVDNARFRVTERHARERIDDIRWESRAGTVAKDHARRRHQTRRTRFESSRLRLLLPGCLRDWHDCPDASDCRARGGGETDEIGGSRARGMSAARESIRRRVCVFDGHGGFEAAERARHLFPEVIARRLRGKVPDHNGVRELLESSFIESDETMAVEYEGCTASVVLVWRDAGSGGLMFQAANVGDSSVAYGRAPALNGEHGARYITRNTKCVTPRSGIV